MWNDTISGNLQQLRLFRIRTWFPFHWECVKKISPKRRDMPLACFSNVSSRWKHGQRHVATLWRYRFWWFDTSPTPNWWYKVTYFFPHHPYSPPFSPTINIQNSHSPQNHPPHKKKSSHRHRRCRIMRNTMQAKSQSDWAQLGDRAMHTQHEPRRGSVMIVKKEKSIP